MGAKARAKPLLTRATPVDTDRLCDMLAEYMGACSQAMGRIENCTTLGGLYICATESDLDWVADELYKDPDDPTLHMEVTDGGVIDLHGKMTWENFSERVWPILVRKMDEWAKLVGAQNRSRACR
jgi:hypothetical protein